ncbi:MAG: hypothetical protein PHQ52_03890 [Candidatus Omnitrophica bacterium]|nr:hypothetical protein [Candidatus Omnitrophota bacterium]
MKKIFLCFLCSVLVFSIPFSFGESIIDHAQQTFKLKHINSVLFNEDGTVTLILQPNIGFSMQDINGNEVEQVTLQPKQWCKLSSDTAVIIYKFKGNLKTVLVFSVENVFTSLDRQISNKESGSVYVAAY